MARQGIEPLCHTPWKAHRPGGFSCDTGQESAPCPLRTCWSRDCRGLAVRRSLLRGSEDVEPDLDLGAVGAGHVALGRGDPQGLPRGAERPAVVEVDFDRELGTVAGELDVFHGGLSFVRWLR